MTLIEYISIFTRSAKPKQPSRERKMQRRTLGERPNGGEWPGRVVKGRILSIVRSTEGAEIQWGRKTKRWPLLGNPEGDIEIVEGKPLYVYCARTPSIDHGSDKTFIVHGNRPWGPFPWVQEVAGVVDGRPLAVVGRERGENHIGGSRVMHGDVKFPLHVSIAPNSTFCLPNGEIAYLAADDTGEGLLNIAIQGGKRRVFSEIAYFGLVKHQLCIVARTGSEWRVTHGEDTLLQEAFTHLQVESANKKAINLIAWTNIRAERITFKL